MGGSGSETISPTAHYTGYVWARNGLSHPQLATLEGRVLFESLRPSMRVSGVLGGASLENYLLARHRAIDTLLERAIEEGAVGQVIEVASGLSPRGWRLTKKYGPELTYIETDLPGMAARKRRALEQMGSLCANHRVQELDVLQDDGPISLGSLASSLDPDQGLAIITEGLLGYLDGVSVDAAWRRFAEELGRFREGRYYSDLHLGDLQTLPIRAFRLMLSAFVRGRVHLHFESAWEAKDELHATGFSQAKVHRAVDLLGHADGDGGGGELVHIIEASTI